MAGREELDLGSWCILRMASADTLSVMDALALKGFEVWTPVDRRIGRMPRTRKEYDKRFALMPSYVFAHVSGMDELLRLAMLPSKDVPRFSMFRHQGGFPLIAEADLSELRSEEKRRLGIFERWRISRMKAPIFSPGTEVLMAEGGFAGLLGKVVGSQGRYTLVDIPGFDQPLKISSLLLSEQSLREADNEFSTAAKAA